MRRQRFRNLNIFDATVLLDVGNAKTGRNREREEKQRRRRRERRDERGRGPAVGLNDPATRITKRDRLSKQIGLRDLFGYRIIINMCFRSTSSSYTRTHVLYIYIYTRIRYIRAFRGVLCSASHCTNNLSIRRVPFDVHTYVCVCV